MKITTSNINSKKINFGEGKVKLYSDFDRSFMPISHKNFKNIPHSENDILLKGYFNRMDYFFNSIKEGFEFIITSGRNFDEYRTVVEMAKDKGFKIPLPDALIVKNGGDRYPKVVSEEVFYNGGEYPFKYEIIDKEKQAELKAKTGWDGKLIKEKFREVFEKYGFEVREPGTTNSASDYGYRSLFFDLYKDATKDNPHPKVIALRRDGNSKLHITYPMNIAYYGMKHKGKTRRTQEIMEIEVRKQLKDLGVSLNNIYWSDLKKGGIESEKHPAVVIEPSLTSYPAQEPLTKLYDTKKAVKKAIRENDLVIVVGDSKNDKEMLNIGNYFEPDKAVKYLSETDEVFCEDVFQKGTNLKETLALKENNVLRKQLKELPVIGIIVKNKDHKPPMIPMAYKEYGKLIEIEEGKLDEGIKKAIKMHADANPKYKEKLSSDILKEIYGVVKNIEKKSQALVVQTEEHSLKDTKESVKKSSEKLLKTSKNKYGWIIGLGVAVIGGLSGLYFYQKKQKKITIINKYPVSSIDKIRKKLKQNAN